MTDNITSKKKFVITLCVLVIVLVICIVCLVVSKPSNNNVNDSVFLETPNDVAMSEQDAQLKEQEEKLKAEFELKQQRQDAISDVIVGALGENNSAWGVYVKGIDIAFEADYNSHQMPSASIIKPFIATCVYDNLDELVAKGNGTDKIDSLIFSMISTSNNSATNSLLKC